MTAPLRRHWSPIAKSRSKKWMSQLSQPILHQIEKKKVQTSKDGHLTGVETHWSVYKRFENFQQELGQRMVIEKRQTKRHCTAFWHRRVVRKSGLAAQIGPATSSSPVTAAQTELTNAAFFIRKVFWCSWVFLDDCIFLLSNFCCYWNMGRLALITLIA